MASGQFLLPFRPAYDSNGKMMPGAQLWFTLKDTDTPATVYTDVELNQPHTNPVVANAVGRFAPIFLDGAISYRVRLYTATAEVGVDDSEEEYNPYVGASDASGMGYIQSGTGAASIYAQAKMRQTVDAREFTGVDTTGLTLSTTGVQNAINRVAGTNDTLKIPAGIKVGALTVGGACTIEGIGTHPAITLASGNYDSFTINSDDVRIRNLGIYDAAKTGGSDFILPVGTSSRKRVFLENLLIYDSYSVFTDSGSGAGNHTTTELRSIQALRQRGPAVALTRLMAFGIWEDLTVEFVGSASPNHLACSVNGSGISGGAVGGLKIKGLVIAGTAGSGGSSSQQGLAISNFSDVEIDALSDTLGGDAFVFNTVNKITSSTLKSQLCDGHAFTFTAVSNSQFDKLLGQGRNTQAGTASKDGLRMVSGCYDIQIGLALLREFTGHGVDKVAAQAGPVIIDNLRSTLNTGRGIKTVGTSTLSVNGGVLSGNTAGNYDLGGTTDRLFNTVLDSGAVSAMVGPGPVTG